MSVFDPKTGKPTWPPIADPKQPEESNYPFQDYLNAARPLKGWDKKYREFVEANASFLMVKADKSSIVFNWEDFEQRTLIAKIFEAIAFAESGFDRCNRYVERGISDPDLVTKKQNVSEGLLQVSYQDQVLYGAKFNWQIDKLLPPTDPNKTIFDPYRNLHCGILIFSKLLNNHRGESFKSAGAKYWSTLRPGSGYDKMQKYLKGIL